MSRESLAGWVDGIYGGAEWEVGPLRLTANNDGEWGVWFTDECGSISVLGPVQLAAENAARAMVAEMAATLGGSVTWATEGGE